MAPVSRVSVIRDFPWLVPQILREQSVGFSRLEELPLEAARETETFRRRGVRSNLAIPLVAGGRVLGSLAFVTVTSEREWPDELVQRLQLVGEVFANALAQKEAEEALRSSEEMKSAILASLASGVAVLDRHGRIVEVNDHWARSARDGGVFGAEVGVDGSFLGACWKAALDGVAVAREAMIGTESVLNGSRTGFALEYAWGAPGVGRWLALSVVPLKGPDGGAVVSHTDVTERKHAEMEAQRSRQELAHFTRVSTMGELTASLAHELNQPLTGILANAQAGPALPRRPPARPRRDPGDPVRHRRRRQARRRGHPAPARVPPQGRDRAVAPRRQRAGARRREARQQRRAHPQHHDQSRPGRRRRRR